AREAAADPYQAIEAILPWTTFIDSVAEAEQLARPARFDPLALLAAAFPRMRRYAPTLLELRLSGSQRVSVAARQPEVAQGTERIRTLEADRARRAHRVHPAAVGAAGLIEDRRHRPPFLRTVRTEHTARSTAGR